MQETKQAIVLASHNPSKLAEMSALLGDLGVSLHALNEFTDVAVAETGLSFVENAIIKARYAAQVAQMPAIADDSGLEVKALQGQPGIYSARFAGDEATDLDNNNKLLAELEAIPESARQARYYCAIVYCRHAHDPTPIICCGSWGGEILTAPRGEGGFGYDPLFFLPEQNCSVAELPKQDKARLSHRAQAMQQLRRALECTVVNETVV